MCRNVSDYTIESVKGHYEVFEKFDRKFVASADTLPEAYAEIDLHKCNVDKTRKEG